MIGIVVVSHGRLGQVLLETAAEIVGPLPASVAASVAVARSQSVEDIGEDIRRAVAAVDQPDGVLILADAFGGTAANIASELVLERKVDVVTGCNLPMLLKLKSALLETNDLTTLAQCLKDYGQRNVVVASDILGADRVRAGGGGTHA
ncbi:MAG: PTS fructose transporter subunit IIA [Deltaproteobacteria bacterium]|nr:PTS fructose transporter subunit IIA [Deltaproteobacteria bacterium]